MKRVNINRACAGITLFRQFPHEEELVMLTPSQKPSLSILINVLPMICICVLPDSHWISGEPSGEKSNVFGPLEMLAEDICLAMARTNRWE